MHISLVSEAVVAVPNGTKERGSNLQTLKTISSIGLARASKFLKPVFFRFWQIYLHGNLGVELTLIIICHSGSNGPSHPFSSCSSPIVSPKSKVKLQET